MTKLSKKDNDLVQQFIEDWLDNDVITAQQAKKMKSSLEPSKSAWASLSIFSFVIAGSCILLAFISLVLDAKWIEWIREKWAFSEAFISLIFFVISFLLVRVSLKVSKKGNTSYVAFETFNIAIMLTVSIAIAYLGRSLHLLEEQVAILIGITALLYGIIAYFLKSKLMWVFAIIGLCGWFAAQTFKWSNEEYYFLGMNYPLRFTIWGMLLWAAAYFLPERFTFFKDISLFWGSLLTFIPAWTLSIFGNFDSFTMWEMKNQSYFWIFALLFSAFVIGSLIFAIKRNIGYLRDIAIVFFLINIYTRYFEYFWDRTNKGIFFLIMAFSFFFIGKRLEKLRHTKAVDKVE